MKKIVEVDIDVLRNEKGEFLVTEDFKAKFLKFITDHFLRKFNLFLHVLDTSNHFFCLNTAHPDDQVFKLGHKAQDEKKTTWLQKLKLKIHRGKRV